MDKVTRDRRPAIDAGQARPPREPIHLAYALADRRASGRGGRWLGLTIPSTEILRNSSGPEDVAWANGSRFRNWRQVEKQLRMILHHLQDVPRLDVCVDIERCSTSDDGTGRCCPAASGRYTETSASLAGSPRRSSGADGAAAIGQKFSSSRALTLTRSTPVLANGRQLFS